MKTRIIHAAKPNGDISDERLYITSDLEAKAEDFFPSNFTIESDTVFNVGMASGFPMDYEFKKVVL